MSFVQALRRQHFAYSRISIPSTCSRRGYAAGAAPVAEAKTKKAPTASTSTAPAPAPTSPPAPSAPSTAAAAARSSCRADTILPGLNYLKGQAPVVARKDEEYPEWLWGTLQPRVYEDDGPGGKKERVERRRVRQQAIKDRNFMQTQ